MHPSHHQKKGICSPRMVKMATGILGMCVVGYITGPPLYWHFLEGLAAIRHESSCPCICDCSTRPLLTFPEGLNLSFIDCMKHDPETNPESEKAYIDLLSDELRLKEAETLDYQRRSEVALLEAKKQASAYQKEADKCNSGMETCEGAREKAKATLIEQKELSNLWEMRARQKGWNDGSMRRTRFI